MFINAIVVVSLMSAGWEGKSLKFEDVTKRLPFQPFVMEDFDAKSAEHHIIWVPDRSSSGLGNDRGFQILASRYSYKGSHKTLMQYQGDQGFDGGVREWRAASSAIVGMGYFKEFNLVRSQGQHYGSIEKIAYVILDEIDFKEEHIHVQLIAWPKL